VPLLSFARHPPLLLPLLDEQRWLLPLLGEPLWQLPLLAVQRR